MNKFKLTKSDREDFVYWLCCLFVGALPKGTNQLQDHNRHCCLGVGVACTVPEDKIVFGKNSFYATQMDGGFPRHQKSAPGWLKNINDEFYNRHGRLLSNLNDGVGIPRLPHPRIAALVTEAFKEELGPYYEEIKSTFPSTFK